MSSRVAPAAVWPATPSDDEELDVCPVCDRAVFSDYTRRHTARGSRWAPVGMPDSGMCHAGCKHRYWQAVERCAATQSYVPTLDEILDCDNRDLVWRESQHERYANQETLR